MLKHPKARYPHYEVPERTAFSAAPKTGDCGKGDMAETVALISRLSAEQGIAVADILHTHGSAFSTYEVVTDRKLPLRKFNGRHKKLISDYLPSIRSRSEGR